MARVDIESQISDEYAAIVARQQAGLHPPQLSPLTPNAVFEYFMKNGPFDALKQESEGGLFRRTARLDPHAAAKSFRGRLFQDLQWITLEQQYAQKALHTPIEEQITFDFFRELYGGKRKKHPLSPNTLCGISTPDFMIVHEVASQTYRMSKLVETSIATCSDYYKTKYEHFLAHKDAFPDYFAFATLRFMPLADAAIDLNGNTRFAEVKPGIIDYTDFKHIYEEVAQQLPTVQYALDRAA